jgi:hypothetical protein
MQRPQGLRALLLEWRRLTEEEGQAILSGRWSIVSEHQARKAGLQAEMTQQLELAQPSRDPAKLSQDSDQGLGGLAREVIALEARNRDLLATGRLNRRSEAQRLVQTVLDLRNMRRAYRPLREACWESYS